MVRVIWKRRKDGIRQRYHITRKYRVKELSYRSRAKKPYAVYENSKVIRRFDTKKEANKYKRTMIKLFKR